MTDGRVLDRAEIVSMIVALWNTLETPQLLMAFAHAVTLQHILRDHPESIPPDDADGPLVALYRRTMATAPRLGITPAELVADMVDGIRGSLESRGVMVVSAEELEDLGRIAEPDGGVH